MNTEIAVIQITNPLQVFSTPQGLDPVIDKIEAEAKSLHADISTEEGREAIRSLAYKIARSKTALDKMGKDLTEDQRKQIEAVNTERSRGWDRLEKLQHEVRKPLTEWEDAEKNRVADHEAALAHIESLAVFDGIPTVTQIEERARQVGVIAPRNWQEFSMRYEYTVKTVSDTLAKLLAEASKRENEAAELARLRQEEADRKQREHEQRIAAEAADKARQETERLAQEAAALERQRVEQERLKAEKAIQDAQEATAKAERDRLTALESARLAAEKAEADRIAAEAQAKRDSEAAVERERQRVAAEKKRQDEEQAARDADLTHRKKVNNEAVAGLIALNIGIQDQLAKIIITAIAKGEIPHVKISY